MSVHNNIFKEMCICKCIDISPIINHLFDVFPEVGKKILDILVYDEDCQDFGIHCVLFGELMVD